MNHTIYAFDKFQIDTQKRLLLRDGQPVQLTSKAFDLLLALIESDGHEITKDELMERVWHNQIVEDANLTVTMSHVRKALGEKANEHRFIVTIPGRGYRFIGELKADEGFIIEQHTLSKITIEQEEEDATTRLRGDAIVSDYETAGLRDDAIAFPQSPNRVVSSSRSLAISSSRSRRLIYILSAAFVLVLLLAGFALWRYYSQQKTQSNPAAIPFAEATIKQLTTKGKVRWAALSPDGKFYAYVLTERDERKESLWFRQTDAGNDLQLRPPAGEYNGLTFSPDSKTLYFTVNSESQIGFFKIPVLGGVAEKLSDNIHTNFSLSPDGKQIAFLRPTKEHNATALVIANLDGTGERELLTRLPDKNFSVNCHAWSPDGSTIAFAAVSDSTKESREIFIINIADGHLEQLTTFEWSRISNLVWQRDGRGLILVAANKTETARQLWQVGYPDGIAHRLSRDTDGYGAALSLSADGNSIVAVQIKRESNIWIAPSEDVSEARQVTFSSINGIYGWDGIDWMPDGGIVFTAGIDRSVAIYSMDANGGNIKQITSAGFYDHKPQVTADGRFIVFQSNRSGGNEIWRVQPDGNGLRQLTTGGGNVSPYPTPDGKWVVYISNRNGKSFVWRVSIEGGEPVQVTDKVSSDPSVSPDGKLIACAYKPDDNTPLKLAVIKLEDGTPVKLYDVPRFARFNEGICWMPDGKAVIYKDREQGIWRQDLDSGQTNKLSGLPEGDILRFGWSRDGKRFAFARGRTVSDAVLIKNFN